MYAYQSADHRLTLYPWGVCVNDVGDDNRYGYQQEDRLWKNILEDLFEDFLCFFFPGVREHFNLDRGVVFLDKELIALSQEKYPKYTSRHVDKLVKVWTRKGDERWILVHVEAEASGKEDFPRRMYEYAWRIRCKYHRPVVSIAIYTDDDPDFCPDHYKDLYLGKGWQYDFHTCKILARDEAELMNSDNPFAMVALAAKRSCAGKRLSEEKRYGLKIELLRLLKEKDYPKEKTDMLLEFTGRMIRLKDEELNHKFNQTQEQLTGRRTPMGMRELVLEETREEGFKHGIEQAKAQFVKSLIRRLSLSEEQIADLAEVPVDFVRKVREGGELNKT